MLENMLRNCGVDKAELSAIAVSVGPGSFTGIRIGCATAKGLSFALGIPCRPVSSLEAIAYSDCAARNGELISVETDARNDFVYNALFRRTDSGLVRLCGDRIINTDTLYEELSGFDGLARHCAEVTAWGVLLAAENAPDAEPVPVYLRPSQAERILAERNKQ
jgi:tRNA threonylcarbamoyladenosine biosynthesis protein TsaB